MDQPVVPALCGGCGAQKIHVVVDDKFDTMVGFENRRYEVMTGCYEYTVLLLIGDEWIDNAVAITEHAGVRLVITSGAIAISIIFNSEQVGFAVSVSIGFFERDGSLPIAHPAIRFT